MLSYWSSKKNATVYGLRRHATLLANLQHCSCMLDTPCPSEKSSSRQDNRNPCRGRRNRLGNTMMVGLTTIPSSPGSSSRQSVPIMTIQNAYPSLSPTAISSASLSCADNEPFFCFCLGTSHVALKCLLLPEATGNMLMENWKTSLPTLPLHNRYRFQQFRSQRFQKPSTPSSNRSITAQPPPAPAPTAGQSQAPLKNLKQRRMGRSSSP